MTTVEPAHVLMLLGSAVGMDSRVKRSAATLAATGLNVTVLSYTPDPRPKVHRDGAVTLMEVPVRWRLRNARVARRQARRKRQLRIFGFRTPEDEQAAKLALHLRRQELVARKGRLLERFSHGGYVSDVMRKAGSTRLLIDERVVRGRSLGIRARSAAQRKLDRQVKLAWRIVDKIQAQITVGAPWRRLLPEVHDYEVAYGPIIDELDPDVIHAHDIHMIGVAANAAARAFTRGKRIPWVYDAHEYVAGLARYGPRTRRWIAGWHDLEREFIRSASRVVTVSPEIAERLQRDYRLRRRPAVVLNCPPLTAPAAADTRNIRQEVGLQPDIPLLAYAGGLAPARGLSTAVEALVHLPAVHLALVCVPNAHVSHVADLRATAERLGVSDRVHFLDPVSPDDVPHFLSTADIAVHTLRHFVNHEVTLPNKIFEYIHAGVPVVVSDVKAMATLVRQHEIGEVFRADDAKDLARAVRTVLASRVKYSDRIRDPELKRQYSWARQAAVLVQLYGEVLGLELSLSAAENDASSVLVANADDVAGGAREPHVYIGPANMAGQGWAWGRALERYRGIPTHVFAVDRGFQQFPADELVSAADFSRSTLWQLRQVTRLLDRATHVLMEAGRPVFGTLNGRVFDADVPMLREAGIVVGLIFHGSEIRDPGWHAQHYPWSPFSDPSDPLTKRLQEQLAELKPRVEAFEGPKFFSTPDLLDDIPDGVWLPVTIDLSVWTVGKVPLERQRPVVVHAPSRAALKGTHYIDAVLQQLGAEDLVDYRRIEGVPNSQLPEAVSGADIVIDHIGIGNYGVFTCEAMATGRVTLSHIHERVRERVPIPIPVIEVRPDTLDEVLRRVITDRDWALESTVAGPEFVRVLHDGERAAEVLSTVLGIKSRTAVS